MKIRKFINSKLSYAIYIVLVAVLIVSCSNPVTEYEYKSNVIKSKTIDLEDGTTRYNVAYYNGISDSYSFGLYESFEVNDTICWKREKGWFWHIVDCN